MSINPYDAMWIVALFDLPTDTRKARKEYSEFRKFLISDGFQMIQYSVYGRFVSSEREAEKHRKRVRDAVPPDGEVRIISLTDKQYSKTEVFNGKVRKTPNPAPQQLSFL